MSDIVILSILKFAGLAVGLASTVWGMTHDLRAEDGQGGKRLTPQGHLAIALAVVGFLVAASSQGFETLAKQAELRNKALADEASAAQEFRNEQRQQRFEDLQRLTRAEQRDARTEQRLRALRIADEQREQALALSRDVNIGSRQNLRRTGFALAQLGRLLQPLGAIRFLITWEIPLGGQLPGLADMARRARDNPSLVSGAALSGDELYSFVVDYRDGPELYPRRQNHFELYEAVHAVTNVSLFADNSALARGADGRSLQDRGDLRFQVQHHTPDRSSPILTFVVHANSLTLMTEVSEARINYRSQNLVAIPDLEGALLALEIDDTPYAERHDAELLAALRRNMRPIQMELTAAGHTYSAGPNEFIRVPRDGRTPAFVVQLRSRSNRHPGVR